MPQRDQTVPSAADARDHHVAAPAAALLGERVRALRQARGLSVRTLAARTDFSPSFISQVENGLASPSIASLNRIAEELGTSLGEFFAVPGPESGHAGAGARVVRAAARRTLVSDWSRARVQALDRPGTGQSLEPVLITFAPGGRSGRSPHPAPHELFALVYDGELTIELGGKARVLARGDAVSIPAGTPHRWENAGPREASVVMVGQLKTPRPAGGARFGAEIPSHHHVSRGRSLVDAAR